MSEALRRFIEEEFPVIPSEMRVFQFLAHDAVAQFQRSLASTASASELSDEDVIARLREPRAFGLFAHRVLDARVSREAKIAVAEHSFDLIPIPAGEHTAFAVEGRTPPALLRFAKFLLENEAFTVLHLLHLVYAAFLDPKVLRDSDRQTRMRVLFAITSLEELPETPRLLAAFQFLASMSPRDAATAFDGIVKAKSISRKVRSGLAAAASGSDGGRAWFAEAGAQEGLLPRLAGSEASRVEFEARVPAVPETVRSRARRWLERHAAGPTAPS